MPLKLGTRLGPYEIFAPIGAGGMGEVYKARDTRLGRDVALKILPEAFAANAERRARFETEARAASALHHPGIVAVFDIGSDNGTAYIVTELVDGATLRQARPESLRRQLDIAAQVAEALAAAHATGITHRDLKPENIMVTGPRTGDPGRAKILDFGLARNSNISEKDATLTIGITNPGALMGTVGYMSPEQVHGRTADARSDIFSLGTLLYELFGGKRAFDGESPAAILSAILKSDPPELPSNVPAGVRHILDRCLEKEPQRRFQSAQDLAFALRAIAGSSVSDTSTPAEIADAPAAKSRVSIWPIATVAAIAIVSVFGFWRLATEQQQVDTSNYRFRPFATEEYAEQNPVWSPDGKSIAYVARPKAEWELTVKGLDGSAPVVLARSDREVRNISWTPDGSRVYYIDGTLGTNKFLSVARAGGEPVAAVEGDKFTAGVISLDGRMVAALTRDDELAQPQKVLMLYSPPGSPGKEVARFPGTLTPNTMAWSPDGGKILLSVRGNGTTILGNDLLLFHLLSGKLKKLANIPAGIDVSPAWLPDNRRVLIAWPEDDSANRNSLWLLDTDTGKRSPVLPGVESVAGPSMSPDGLLAYTSGPRDYDLMELPLDGSKPTPLLSTRQWEADAAWSPIAPEFVYVSHDSIRLRRRDGTLDRTVVTTAQFPGQPRRFVSPSFSPDGKRILFTTLPDRKGWISPVGGGSPTPMGDLEGRVRGSTWSPDGKWIATSWAEGKEVLVKIRVGSSSGPQVLWQGQAASFAPSWSPDGSRILAGTAGSLGYRLFTISAEGGEPEFLGKEYEPLAVWSPDIRFIYAIKNADGKRQLGKLDWKNGAFQAIVDIPAEYVLVSTFAGSLRLSLAPDGKSLATTLQKNTGDIWLLDGFAPPPTLWQRLFVRR